MRHCRAGEHPIREPGAAGLQCPPRTDAELAAGETRPPLEPEGHFPIWGTGRVLAGPRHRSRDDGAIEDRGANHWAVKLQAISSYIDSANCWLLCLVRTPPMRSTVSGSKYSSKQFGQLSASIPLKKIVDLPPQVRNRSFGNTVHRFRSSAKSYAYLLRSHSNHFTGSILSSLISPRPPQTSPLRT